MSEKIETNNFSALHDQQAGYINYKINDYYVKKYFANFIVTIDEKGYLCAADMEQGIFTDGKTNNELLKNIHEVVEAYFDVPSYDEVDIKITYK